MIAEVIGKDKPVICRELKRNASNKSWYSYEYAQEMAELRKGRMKKLRKLFLWLKNEFTGMTEQDWSLNK